MMIIFGVFALVMLIVFWVKGDFSLRTKLIITGIYFAIFLLDFVLPFATVIAHGVFALGLYFLVFPSGWGEK
jgi:hypothetical protein